MLHKRGARGRYRSGAGVTDLESLCDGRGAKLFSWCKGEILPLPVGFYVPLVRSSF